MPPIVQGEKYFSSRDAEFLRGMKAKRGIDYSYPNDLDLRPDGETHRKLVSELRRRAQLGSDLISDRYSAWKDIDRVTRAFVRPEAAKRSVNASDGVYKPNITDENYQVVMPISFINRETLMTFLVNTFLVDPVFKYQGTGPEDWLGGKLLTLDVNQQFKASGSELQLIYQMQDALTYGIGVVSPRWEEVKRKVIRREVQGEEDALGGITITGTKRKERTETVYSGFKLHNLDPYGILPDPGVPAHEVQNAEFFGWVENSSWLRLLEMEKTGGSPTFFNAQYLDGITDGRSVYAPEMRYESPSSLKRTAQSHKTSIDLVWMYVSLIPSAWGLGDGKYPEKWVFCLAGDNVIVAAEKIGGLNEEYPLLAMAPDSDGYTAAPVSRMEISHDLQLLSDFLWSARIQNVRRLVNLMLIVDPSIIMVKDVVGAKNGGLIRAKEKAWMQGRLRDAWDQITIQDVTQGHATDADYLMGMAQRVTGANDTAEGNVVNHGPRISGAATQRAAASTLGRVGMIARKMSLQSMIPLARMLGEMTQENRDGDVFLQMTGETLKRFQKDFPENRVDGGRVRVPHLEMLVPFDVVPYDGSVPGVQDVNIWTTLLDIAARNPLLASQLEMGKIFRHIAREMGATNVDQFLKAEDDNTVLQQEQQGNLVPLPPQALNGIPQ